MSGVRDLTVLLGSMEAEVRPGLYVFTTVPDAAALGDVKVQASVVEPEGLSVVVARDDADLAGLPYDFVAAWITLRAHSALDAVGLTAAVSSALADAGISCNVIAGHHHDHLLVPADRTDDAMAELRRLSARA